MSEKIDELLASIQVWLTGQHRSPGDEAKLLEAAHARMTAMRDAIETAIDDMNAAVPGARRLRRETVLNCLRDALNSEAK